MKLHIAALIILVFFSLWSVKAFFHEGFFPMHDDTQVGRVVAMGRALRAGQFPVRWVSDLGYGYGYPIFNFYGPLPYYVGGSLYVLGLNGLTAAKAMFVIGIVFSGITAYLLGAYFLGTAAGLLVGLLYVFAPYHAVDIYVRGAVGEFWALSFLPLFVFGILLCAGNKQKIGLLLGGMGLAGIILSHTILGYMTVGLAFFLLLIEAVLWRRRKISTEILIAQLKLIGVGVGLSSFFWLPAIFEMSYTNVAAQIKGSADFHNHFVCLSQLWNSDWGFGGSQPGCTDGLSFRLGKLHILLAVFGASVFIWKKKQFKNGRRLWWIGLGITLVSVFFMTSWSRTVWEILPGFPYIQYPWRFLTFAVLGLSVLSGFSIHVLDKRVGQWAFGLVLMLTAIFLYSKLFVPQSILLKPSEAYESPEELQFRVSKISDEYLPPSVPRPLSPSQIPKEAISATSDLDIETEIDTQTYLKFILISHREQNVIINRAFFPGWKYLVDGRYVTAEIVNGLPMVHLQQGQHVIEMQFINTPIRTIANTISLLVLGYIIFIYGKKTLS